MKSKKTVHYRICPSCGRKFTDPYNFFRLPDDLQSLAQELALPAKTVKTMIDTKKIPLRRFIDKRGRRRGPYMVMLGEALKAVNVMAETSAGTGSIQDR